MCFEVFCSCGYKCRDHALKDLTCPKCGGELTAIEQDSHNGKYRNSRSIARSLLKRKRQGEK